MKIETRDRETERDRHSDENNKQNWMMTGSMGGHFFFSLSLSLSLSLVLLYFHSLLQLCYRDCNLTRVKLVAGTPPPPALRPTFYNKSGKASDYLLSLGYPHNKRPPVAAYLFSDKNELDFVTGFCQFKFFL